MFIADILVNIDKQKMSPTVLIPSYNIAQH